MSFTVCHSCTVHRQDSALLSSLVSSTSGTAHHSVTLHRSAWHSASQVSKIALCRSPSVELDDRVHSTGQQIRAQHRTAQHSIANLLLQLCQICCEQAQRTSPLPNAASFAVNSHPLTLPHTHWHCHACPCEKYALHCQAKPATNMQSEFTKLTTFFVLLTVPSGEE